MVLKATTVGLDAPIALTAGQVEEPWMDRTIGVGRGAAEGSKDCGWLVNDPGHLICYRRGWPAAATQSDTLIAGD